MHSFWELVLSNSWQVDDSHLTGQVLLELSVAKMKLEYIDFVDEHRAAVTTPIQDFSAKMFGEKTSRTLALKASETYGFFQYICSAISAHKDTLACGDTWESCRRLLSLMKAPGIPARAGGEGERRQ